jgi:signal transduction histidine kinase
VQREVTQSRETDFGRIVTEAVKGALDTSPDIAAGVGVNEKIPSFVPPVIVNTPQIEQVVRNLVKNALEAPRTSAPLEIDVSISGGEEFVEVAIRDNAAGIPDAQREEVFTPYVSTKPGGSGIGLALCRDIVEAHGGRLWFDSVPGRGTVFHFTVPRAPAG